MKKKTIITLIIAVIVLVLLGIGVFIGRIFLIQKSSIGSEKALNFACINAGIDSKEATVKEVDFERENGEYIYKIEFISDGVEYEYWLRASDGTVLKAESEIIDELAYKKSQEKKIQEEIQVELNQIKEQEAAIQGDGYLAEDDKNIKLEEAKKIAVQQVGAPIESVIFKKAEIDIEDGKEVYDIEFYYQNQEYSVEIDVMDGSIIDIDD